MEKYLTNPKRVASLSSIKRTFFFIPILPDQRDTHLYRAAGRWVVISDQHVPSHILYKMFYQRQSQAGPSLPVAIEGNEDAVDLILRDASTCIGYHNACHVYG